LQQFLQHEPGRHQAFSAAQRRREGADLRCGGGRIPP
jgi:hypothetical protein